MQIVLEVSENADGRLVGVVRSAPGRAVLPFAGTLELLARLEEMCRPNPSEPTTVKGNAS